MALTAAVVTLLLAAPPLTAPSGSATPSRSIFSSVASGLNMGIRSPMLGSATKTMGEMYAHWCSTRADSLLCKRRDISLQLAKATPDDKKTLLQKLKELGSSRPLPSSGGASGGSSLSKEYSAMKLSWCATEAGRATSMCTHPSQRYANTSLGRPRGAPPTPSSSEAVTWFCEKPGKAEDPVCLRRTLLAKLRERTAASAGQSAEEKRKVYTSTMEQLRAVKIEPGMMQAVFADFCKGKEHESRPTCHNLKTTQTMTSVTAAWCGQEAHKEGPWCKRLALVDELKKLSGGGSPLAGVVPSTAGSADAARRKELSSQLRALPMSKDTMEEVIKAKAEWCAVNPAAAASSPVCAVKKASSAGLKTEPRV